MSLPNILTFITWDVDPDIFVVPYLEHPVRWYGLFWAFGLIISSLIMTFIYKREGRSSKEVDTLTLYLFAGTLLGARLGHVLFYDPVYFFQNPVEIIAIWEGGLASHGGGIGVLIAAYLFARKTKVNYLWLLDRLVIITAFTACCIRVGNLMNSEMAGIPTDLPWGVIFTRIDSIPRHPAQVYEAINYFFLFLLSFAIWNKRREQIKNGFLLGWFLILLFTLRFVVEFFKINQVPFEDELILNMGQLLSIPFIIAGIVILLTIRKQKAASNTNDTLIKEEQINTE